MSIRLHLATVVLAASLAGCAYDLRLSIGPATGVDLDEPASGDRSARESQYLKQGVLMDLHVNS